MIIYNLIFFSILFIIFCITIYIINNKFEKLNSKTNENIKILENNIKKPEKNIIDNNEFEEDIKNIQLMLKNKVDKSYLVDNYNTKQNIDDMLINKVDKSYLVDNYNSKDDSKENIIDKTDFDNYYDKNTLDELLSDKVTIENLNNYYDKEIFEDKLSKITSEFNIDLDDLNINLSSKIKTLEKSKSADLSNYYTKLEVDDNLNKTYENISKVETYIIKINKDLKTQIQDLSIENQDVNDSISKIYNKFDNYINKKSLDNYYTKENIDDLIFNTEEKIPTNVATKSYISDNFYNKKYIDDNIKDLNIANDEIMYIMSTKADKSYLKENYYDKIYITDNYYDTSDTYNKSELYSKDVLYTKQDVDDLIKNDIPTGTIIMYTGSLFGKEFLLCDGGEVDRNYYQKLFNIIGTTFGSGDGYNTFNLPKIGAQSISQNKTIDYFIKY